MRRRVLIPLDGTKVAENALDVVRDFCSCDDQLVIVKLEQLDDLESVVYRSGLPLASGIITWAGEVIVAAASTTVSAETRDQRLQIQAEEAGRYLEEVACRLREEGFGVTTEVLVAEEPGVAIVEYARRELPDLIVLVRRGHPGLIGMMLESVATHIVEAEVAPVLCVPPRP